MQGCAPIIEICCSAPGKIILFGEHAVVYGTNALLGAINLRTQCSVSKPRDAIQSDLVIIINQDDVRYVYTIRKTEICDVFHEINAMQSKLTLSSDFSDSQLQYDENKTYKAIQSHIFEKFKKKEIIEIPEQFLNSIRCVLGVLTASICHQATNFKIFNESNIPCYIEFTSTIPIGCGIGSSAAFNSSLSASLFMFFKFQANQSLVKGNEINQIVQQIKEIKISNEDLEQINKLAYFGEHFFHGNPSGADNNVCVYGGIERFKKQHQLLLAQQLFDDKDEKIDKGNKSEKYQNSSQQFKYEQILQNNPNKQFHILIVNSKVRRNTGILVNAVSTWSKHEDNKQQFKDGLQEIDSIVLDAIKHMNIIMDNSSIIDQYNEQNQKNEREQELNDENNQQKQAYNLIGELITRNHQILQQWGVSHDKIEEIRIILSHYSIPGKLTGAGGGGCVFGLLQDQMDQLLIKAVCEDLSAAGFEPFVARVGEDGVRIELLK